MSLKKDFFTKRDQIVKEIEKLTERNVIFGVRYFDHISPDRADYIKPDNCKEVPYPEESPYSSSIVARRVGWDEGDKKEKKTEEKREKMQENEKNVEGEQEEKGEIKEEE